MFADIHDGKVLEEMRGATLSDIVQRKEDRYSRRGS